MIVVEDENGNIVRETMKDTDTLARYKTMHETLVYLAHLDHDDTETQMLDKLRKQVLGAPRCLKTPCCRGPAAAGAVRVLQDEGCSPHRTEPMSILSLAAVRTVHELHAD